MRRRHKIQRRRAPLLLLEKNLRQPFLRDVYTNLLMADD